MATDKQCIEYARECMRLADNVPDPEIRQQLQKLANDWMAVSTKEDKTAIGNLEPPRLSQWSLADRIN